MNDTIYVEEDVKVSEIIKKMEEYRKLQYREKEEDV